MARQWLPFEPPELLARIEALLRRVRQERLPPVTSSRFANVQVDFEKGHVQRMALRSPWPEKKWNCCDT